MTLTLYTARFDTVPVIGCSPPSWAVWLAYLEKGLSIEHHQLDFAAGEHRSAEFLAKNPKGTLPTLFDGSRLVSETPAILQCIDRQNDVKLLGETQVLRARGTQRLNFAFALKEAGMAYLAAKMKQETPIDELEQKYVQLIEQMPPLFGSQAFIASPDEAGSRPGLADLLCFSYLAASEGIGLSLSPWPRLELWMRAMRMRASVESTQPKRVGAGRQS